jgi:serine/threonine protein kinase
VAIFDGWEALRDEKNPDRDKTLGKGGQGTVYLVRTPEAAQKRRNANAGARRLLTQVVGGRYEPDELANFLSVLAGPDAPSDLGALKVFEISADDADEEARAIGRLESEIRALQDVKHPAVLKLLHANVAQRFIVTEYHRLGPLSENLNRYRGNALGALQAFRGLVDGAVAVHQIGGIHRDIKPANIFVSESGDLVLGDFGIVFFRSAGQQRLTKTVGELVGSHFWMPPWTYIYERIGIDQVNSSFDIYPLGKVLWSMISGRNGFPREEFERDENNLEKMFPMEPAMRLINCLLAKCVVREESECISASSRLRSEVDILIAKIKERQGYRPDGAQAWPCRVCGKGDYQDGGLSHKVRGYRPGGPVQQQTIELDVYLCDHCGHAELFGKPTSR